MRPADIQQIGPELAIKWEEGGESYISLEKMAALPLPVSSTTAFTTLLRTPMATLTR